MAKGFKFGRDVIKNNNNNDSFSWPYAFDILINFLFIRNAAVSNKVPSFDSYDLKIAKLP